MSLLRGLGVAAALAATIATTSGAAWAQVASPSVEINTASEAELDSVRGIGPDLNARIRAQRDQRPFADWTDFIARIKPMGPARARQLSDAGLRVAGQPFGKP